MQLCMLRACLPDGGIAETVLAGVGLHAWYREDTHETVLIYLVSTQPASMQACLVVN
jgi:hypothetical protein